MTYNLTFKKSVAKDLRKIEKSEADRILRKIAAELPAKAEALPELRGKYSGLKKFRVGNYRIVFATVQNTIIVTRIRHRREVYRN